MTMLLLLDILTLDRFCGHVEFEPYGTLVSCDARFYIQYLHWVLDRNLTHRLDSIITNWNYIRIDPQSERTERTRHAGHEDNVRVYEGNSS